MTGDLVGPAGRTRSKTTSSAGSFDASRAAAHSAATAAASLSLSGADSHADRHGQAEADGGEGKEEAVEGGEMVEVSSGSTDTVSSNVHSGRGHVVDQDRSASELTSGVANSRSGRPHTVTVSEVVCSVDTCTHCCTCHILHSDKKGYGVCMKGGKPWPDCRCRAMCPPGRCAQYDCNSRFVLADASQSSSPVSPSTQELKADELDEPRSPARRVSSRVVSSPVRLEDVQAQERQLEEYHREHQAAQAAAAAAEEAPAAAAVVAPQAQAPLPTVAAIASHRPLHNTIPFADHTAWIERCVPVFEQYRQASATNDGGWMASSLVDVLQLPSKYLFKQRIHAHERRMLNRQQQQSGEWQMKRLSNRLRRSALPAAAAAVAVVPAAAVAAEIPGEVPVAHRDDSGEDEEDSKYGSNDELDALAVESGCTEDDLRAIKHARRLLASGHMAMASRAAATDHHTLDCNDPAVMQQLRQLHPEASDTPMPALPYDAHTPLVLNDSALIRLIRRCNNGKAGGPSGWNGAMLAVLSDSPTCMEGIRSIISDITLGRIPPAVRPHITATRLIALAKPNGAPRPIAMGELFYRVAAVRAVRSASDAARGLLSPHQFGVGVAGGCEHIVHCMQHSLTHIADNRPLAAVKMSSIGSFINVTHSGCCGWKYDRYKCPDNTHILRQ